MPGHCCVPLCRANYPGGPKARVYGFPTDIERRNKWLRAIPRRNFTPTKCSKVCDRHFEEHFFVRSIKHEDPATGKVIEVSRSYIRLTDDAVPTIFPERPSYHSKHPPSRESPEEKRSRREFEGLQKAVRNSVQTFKEEGGATNSAQTFQEKKPVPNPVKISQEEKCIKPRTFSDLLAGMEWTQVSDFWTVVREWEFVMFLNLSKHEVPTLQYTVTIKRDLSVTVAIRGTKVVQLPGLSIPKSLSNMDALAELLEHLEQHATEATQQHSQFEAVMALIISLLEDICHSESPDRQASLTFLRDQALLIFKRSSYYSVDKLVISALLYAISPHAYNLMRSSGISLPHCSTLWHLCSTYKTIPSSQVQDHNVVSHLGSRARSMEDHQKVVALMMNDVHIKPYYSCIDGTMGETSVIPPKPEETAHVFMLQNLMTRNSDVAHILVSSDITAELLHSFMRQLIVRLENIGLRIICITTDNNSTSKKAIAMFRQPAKLDIVYPHPADPSRPLFFVINSVHLLKCVIDDWINQEDQELSLVFPEFRGSEGYVSAASLATLRKLCSFEKNGLIRSPGSIKKVLYPAAIGKQNPVVALKVFNKSVIKALRMQQEDLEFASDTANFIEILTRWHNIVNIKRMYKGQLPQGHTLSPITSMDDPQLEYLSSMVDWLDKWEALRLNEGVLTTETHAALRLSCYSVLELCRYCFEELHFTHVPIGQFQTKFLLCHE